MAKIKAFEIVYNPGNNGANIRITTDDGSTYPIQCKEASRIAIVVSILNGPSPSFFDPQTGNFAITKSIRIQPVLLAIKL